MIIDVGGFLLELRTNILNVTINKFIEYMNWSNIQYYSRIVCGYTRKNKEFEYSRPSVHFIFSGLDYAFKNHKEFQDHKDEIIDLLFQYLLPSLRVKND